MPEDGPTRKQRRREADIARHLSTDWSDADRFPALVRLGCNRPEPFVDPRTDEDDSPLMLRCGITGQCFTVPEAKGDHWIPSPSELLERRNAIRDTWTEDEASIRDVTQGATAQERAEAKRCVIPTITMPAQ